MTWPLSLLKFDLYIVMLNEFVNTGLTDQEFLKLSRFIYDECGIKMPPAKKVMLEARLRKRIRELNLKTFSEYCNLVFNLKDNDLELVNMIDVVTTNKTEFFRESKQFNYLTDTALPLLKQECGAGTRKRLKVWSAGCSTGEEPYTLAMVLNEYAENDSGFDYSILATDISTQVLKKAHMGIYPMERIESIPINLKKKYLLRSKDKTNPLVRIVPELRNKVNFRRINFMDNDFGFSELQDVIFCRNVIIYFDKPTQQNLIAKFCDNLQQGGYLFLGHSETLFNMELPLVQVAASTYRRI